MNAERALANQPALRLDDPAVFAGRLHYQEGKQCYTVVFRELKELKELKSASAPAAAGPSAGAGLADQRASQPRRAPKQTALQRLIADAGELTVDALLDGGTISVPALRRRTGRTPPTPDADRNEPPADAEMADAHDAQGEGRQPTAAAHDAQGEGRQPTAATSEAAPKSARAIQMAATRERNKTEREAREHEAAEMLARLGPGYKGNYVQLQTEEEQRAWRQSRSWAIKELTKENARLREQNERALAQSAGNAELERALKVQQQELRMREAALPALAEDVALLDDASQRLAERRA